MQDKAFTPLTPPPGSTGQTIPQGTPTATSGQLLVDGKPLTAPADVFQALRAQRRELGNQLSGLEGLRRDLSARLDDASLNGADRVGLEERLKEVDKRISDMDKQIAASDAQVSAAAAIPGAAIEPPPPPRTGPPEEVYFLSGIFIFAVLLPLSIAFAHRILRRGANIVAALPREIGERFTRLEQSVDSIAVEVERIGEGQRFITRLFTDEGSPRAVGAGAAEPVEVKAREGAPATRR